MLIAMVLGTATEFGAEAVLAKLFTAVRASQAAKIINSQKTFQSNELLTQKDLTRLELIRNDLGITSNRQLRRNVAYGEGHVDGIDLGEIVGVSGNRGPGADMPENRIFTTSVDGHPRDLDSEVFVLENMAQKISPNSTGNIFLVSERTVCTSCQGVISQFREMFPNINLIVRAGQ